MSSSSNPPPPPAAPAAAPLITPKTTSSTPPSSNSCGTLMCRDYYRKGNWTQQETLVLITAKRLDTLRRRSTTTTTTTTADNSCGGGPTATTPQYRSSSSSAGLRWKWIENYCCANGCVRSQNQCNDKWDNLLRDYKKVAKHQQQSSSSTSSKSYWQMDKHERKDNSLPFNLSLEIFHALKDVINACRIINNHRRSMLTVPVTLTPCHHHHPPPPPPQPQHEQKEEVVVQSPLPVVTAPDQAAPIIFSHEAPMPPQPSAVCADRSNSSDSGAPETSEPDPKRKKIQDASSSVVRGASMLAQTLLECEEKREKQHRGLMELQERKLRIQSEQAEINRQGFSDLISAVNSLSNAVHAFVDSYQTNGNAR